MAEVITIIGLAAALTQFIEYGLKLSARLDELSTSATDRPHALAALKVRLPAVIAVVRRIQKQIDSQSIDYLEAETLLPLIANTNAHVQALLGILEKGRGGKAGVVGRYVKGMRSLAMDKEVQRLNGRVQENLQVIALVQTTGLVEVSWRTAELLGSEMGALRSVGGTVVGREDGLAGDGGRVSVVGSQGHSTSMAEEDAVDIQLAISAEPDAPDPQTPTPTPPSPLRRLPPRPHPPKNKQFSHSRCPPSCSCLCHRPHHLSTPTLLSSLLGHLSLTYTNARALLPHPCTEKNCLRPPTTSSTTRFTYRFPSWAAAQVIHMSLSSTALNTHINLNTLRILPDSAEVFSVISRGDLHRLRTMFANGETSIYDISRSNWTLLHSAFTLGRMEMSNFLITQGADLHIEAANGSNVVERAWFLAQKSTKVPGDYVMSDNEILKAVDVDDFVSAQQYNLIHKIVLGITKLDLQAVLASSTAGIDGVDLRGATPLWWAAAQGNVKAMQTLLENGADVDAQATLIFQRPLHVVRNGAAAGVLLEYGAQVDSVDGIGRTPLHCFCYRQVGSSAALVKEVLERGAKIDARANGGQTALHYASMFGNANLISTLLEYGAEIDAVKNDGLTPLSCAVRYDQTDALEALLSNGAEYTVLNRAWQNVLHLAAMHAGPACMDILADLDLDMLDSNARDNKGMTPRECFEGRKFRFEDLDVAFGKLMLAAGGDTVMTPDFTDGEEENDSGREEQTSEHKPMPGSFSVV